MEGLDERLQLGEHGAVDQAVGGEDPGYHRALVARAIRLLPMTL